MREFQIEELPQLVDPHRPRHAQPAEGVAPRTTRRRPFVDIPDHFLEQVFERDDSRCPSVFVDDDCHLCPLAAHRREDDVEECGFGDHRGLARA